MQTSVETILLKDADEILAFLQQTTGMVPDYRQLSRGASGLIYRVVDLDGVKLLWARNAGHGLWRDTMADDGSLHMGFVVAAQDEVLVRGAPVSAEDAMVWMAGAEMEHVHKGGMETLEIWVSPEITEELGWLLGGCAFARAPKGSLQRLTRLCRTVTDCAQSARQTGKSYSATAHRAAILEALETALVPWRAGTRQTLGELRHYRVFAEAERIFDLDQDDAPDLDQLANGIGVSRRTLFAAFQQSLGLGPRRYFEVKRLHILRNRLQSPSDLGSTVTRCAMELGFNDLGRLAARYRALFGENPGETLRKAMS